MHAPDVVQLAAGLVGGKMSLGVMRPRLEFPRIDTLDLYGRVTIAGPPHCCSPLQWIGCERCPQNRSLDVARHVPLLACLSPKPGGLAYRAQP